MEFKKIKQNGFRQYYVAEGLNWDEDGAVSVYRLGGSDSSWSVEVTLPVGVIPAYLKKGIDEAYKNDVEDREKYGYGKGFDSQVKFSYKLDGIDVMCSTYCHANRNGYYFSTKLTAHDFDSKDEAVKFAENLYDTVR